jgi:hypothetical protein
MEDFPETYQKILEAIKPEYLKISPRHYGTRDDNGHTHQTSVLFLCTSKGIYGEPDTLGKMEYTVHENVNLSDVYEHAAFRGEVVEGRMGKLIHFDRMAIYSQYRNHRLSERLVESFFDIYEKQFNGIPLSIEFMNPVAEYLYRKVLKRKNMLHVLNEKLIRRYYGITPDYNDADLINTLKEKDPTLFPYHAMCYIGHQLVVS